MAKGPNVCMTCRNPIRDPFAVIERRIEYRRKRTESRMATVMTGHLCEECAGAEIAAVRPDPTNTNQGSML